MADNDADRPIPPYVPYDTFVSTIAHLKATALPSRIDKSAFPPEMHTLQRGQVQSALRFLGLIDSAGTTGDAFAQLVDAHGTEEWKQALSDHVFCKYHNIIGELDTDRATQKQLDERFQGAGVEGQMLLKAVRFYLAVMTDAGLTFSPHLTARRKSTTVKKKPAAKSAARTTGGKPAQVKDELGGNGGGNHAQEITPSGMIDFPLVIGNDRGLIRVPLSITSQQYKFVEAMLSAVKVMAEDNDKKHK